MLPTQQGPMAPGTKSRDAGAPSVPAGNVVASIFSSKPRSQASTALGSSKSITSPL
jgi:hypothetical protein